MIDEILGDMQDKWRSEGKGWALESLRLAALDYADGVILLADTKEATEGVLKDCLLAFAEAGLEIGLDKTH